MRFKSRNILDSNELSFMKSMFSTESISGDESEILTWIKEQSNKIYVTVERINLNNIDNWNFNKENGCINHVTGHFFSIEGIEVSTNWGVINKWDQPIISQPEIGYLGFIVKEFNGVLHFLMQAKIEPGNINYVQLSPTIQATKSNYSQVHNGSKTPYLEYFKNVRNEDVLLDQLHSEQGSRFLKKRNRNIIINVENNIELLDNYIWVTLGQIKNLMKYDNIVNMDTRTIISCINYGNYDLNTITLFDHILSLKLKHSHLKFEFMKSALIDDAYTNDVNEIIHQITKNKSKYELQIKNKSLYDLENWLIKPDEIVREDGKFFKVIAVNVSISNREVKTWQQPMIQPSQTGLCAFICQRINGVMHFLVQLKIECGNRDIVELAPTIQCITGDYKLNDSQPVPFLDRVLNSKKENIFIDTLQSEEGGRFYQENNRNIIVIVDDNDVINIPDNFIWMTLNQLSYFNRFNNYLNIQARNLISTINFI